MKTGRTEEPMENYVLIEDVQKSWDHRELDKGGGSQRVLEAGESVLQAQNKWKGSGRFLLRKKSVVSFHTGVWVIDARRGLQFCIPPKS